MRTLILGAGFGGLTAAVELARLAPSDDITLVDERETYLMGATKLWILDGRRAPGEGTRRIADVERHGVRFVRGSVEAIAPSDHKVQLSGGLSLPYDRLIVALGARLAMDAVPGLAQHARNLYSAEGIAAFHDDLTRLRGGKVLILVCAMPFKCPPAPYEAAMLAKAFLDARGSAADVTIASPEPHPLPIAGRACGDTVREWVEERGVRVLNGRQVAAVEAGRVLFADGSSEAFDILAAVPPHRAPEPVRAIAGESGWLAADPATLRTSHPDVWAIGDCNVVKLANGKPLVKAGLMAEGEARVVARNLAAGGEASSFDGKGSCFLEVGQGLGIEVKGDFYARPDPIVTVSTPDAKHLVAKHAFETDRLRAWFGA